MSEHVVSSERGALPPGGGAGWHEFGRWIGRWWYRPWYRVRVRGVARVPRTGPLVVVANHSSLVEPALLFGMLPRWPVFLVKQELYRGALGWALRRLGQIAVDRGRPGREPLAAAVRVLRAGGLVGVFPEGTRGAGDVSSAEQGAAWLVRSSGAVVLPVASRGTLRPAGSRRRFRPRIDVTVGEPFAPEVGRGRAGLVEGTETIRVALADLVAELDAERSGRRATPSKEDIQ